MEQNIIQEGHSRHYISVVQNLFAEIPKLGEQNKIAEMFKIVDNLITLYERKVKLLTQIKKYLLDNLFAEKDYPNLRFKGFANVWEQRQLEELGNIFTGNTPSKSHYEYYSNNKKDSIPWITPTDIDDEYTKNTNFYLTLKGQDHARIVPPNTLLMTCIASIGKNTITTYTSGFNQQINAIIPNKEANIKFLYFISIKISKYMSKIAPAGMMPIINKAEFSKIKVSVPVIKEQNKISNLMENLNYLITVYKNKHQQLNQIKNTLLNTMFI